MSKMQIFIDELEARADELKSEISIINAEMDELTAKGKALALNMSSKMEERNNHVNAINALRAIEAGEVEVEVPPMLQTEDPWGGAG